MAHGLKVLNASGQVSFDTSRLGGVVRAVQQVGPSGANLSYTYTFTVPSGARVRPIVLASDTGASYLSISASIVDTTLTLTVVFTNTAGSGFYLYVLLLLY